MGPLWLLVIAIKELFHIDVSHTQQELLSGARLLQRILDHFWNIWRAEYLTQLRKQRRCC